MRRLCAALLGVLLLIGTAHAAPSKYMVTQDTMATSDTTLFKVYGKAQIDSMTVTGLDSVSGRLSVNGPLTVAGKFTAGDAAADTFLANGKAWLVGPVRVGHASTAADSTLSVTGGLSTTGGAKIGGSLNVTGVSTLTGGISGGLLVGTTTAQTGGVVVGSSISASANATVALDYLVGAGDGRIISKGPDATTVGGLQLLLSEGDGGGGITAWTVEPNGDFLPGSDNGPNLGSAAASWDSLWLHVAAVVGDMPYLDTDADGNPVDDVADICAIRGSGVRDAAGYEIVDDSTMPRDIMLTHREDAPARMDTVWSEVRIPVDSTVASYTVRIDSTGKAQDAEPVYDVTYRTERTVERVVEVPAHKRGDLVIGASGKPYVNLLAADGKVMGAIRQQAAVDDSLRARIAELEQWRASVEERLAKLESR